MFARCGLDHVEPLAVELVVERVQVRRAIVDRKDPSRSEQIPGVIGPSVARAAQHRGKAREDHVDVGLFACERIGAGV